MDDYADLLEWLDLDAADSQSTDRPERAAAAIRSLRSALEDAKAEAEDWKDKWRWERSHGCPDWGNHTSDGRDRVCWHRLPESYHDLRAAMQRAEEARDSAQRALEEERAIVDRIWDIFGRPDYKSLNGKTIYDLVAALQHDVEFMRQMLKAAKCPTCDNSGTTKYGDECEWCYYRNRSVADR